MLQDEAPEKVFDIKSESIRVSPLGEFPDYAPVLAFWSYRQWYTTRSIPFEAVLKSYQVRARGVSIPLAFVATVNTMPAGMISLKLDDLWSRKDLNPWLASLYVLPEFRKRGIAEMLMKRVIENAANLNLERMYLFLGQSEKDQLQSYYMKRGWVLLERAVDNDGHDTEIFQYRISRNHIPYAHP